MQKRPAAALRAWFLVLVLAGIWFPAVQTSEAAGQKDAGKSARTSSAAAPAAAKTEAASLNGTGKEEDIFSREPVENVLRPPKQEKTGRMDPLPGQEQSAAEKEKKEEMRRLNRQGKGAGQISVWLRKGLEYGAQKEYDKAIDVYTKAIQHDAADATGYYNRGVVYQKCARYDLAIRDYTKASQLTPDDPDIYYNRGLSYHSAGQPDLAVKDYSRAIALSRSDPSPFWNRAVAFARAGKQDLALADYCMALDLLRQEAQAKAKTSH